MPNQMPVGMIVETARGLVGQFGQLEAHQERQELPQIGVHEHVKVAAGGAPLKPVADDRWINAST